MTVQAKRAKPEHASPPFKLNPHEWAWLILSGSAFGMALAALSLVLATR